MRAAMCSLLFLSVFGYLFAAARPDASSSDNFISYNTGGDSFAVIYVNGDEKVSGKAKKYAMKRAAEIAVQNDFRYFTIDSEKEVMVARSDTENGQRFPGNMYQELIVEGDFEPTPDYRTRNLPPATGLYPGYKLNITCYKEKPGMRAVDACKLTKCS